MTRSLTAGGISAIASGHLVQVTLVLLQFSANGGADVALCSANRDVVYSGTTYLGAAGLGTISPIKDSPGEIKGIQFELAGVAASMISLALDSADDWQGAPVIIRTALLDGATNTVQDAPIEWTGRGDTLSIEETGDTCAVVATAESNAVDLLHGNPSTYTDADQQVLYSGDLAFQYVVDQSDQRDVWPAREHFFK